MHNYLISRYKCTSLVDLPLHSRCWSGDIDPCWTSYYDSNRIHRIRHRLSRTRTCSRTMDSTPGSTTTTGQRARAWHEHVTHYLLTLQLTVGSNLLWQASQCHSV